MRTSVENWTLSICGLCYQSRAVKRFTNMNGLIDDILQAVSERGEFREHLINLALLLKEHWQGLERDAPVPYGWDREIIIEFARAFNLEASFEDWEFVAVLTARASSGAPPQK